MTCNVARDLLPLYFDGLCSEETREQLEGHMESCAACRALRQSLEQESEQADIDMDRDRDIQPLRKIHSKLRRKNILIAACVFFLLLTAAGTALLAYGQMARRGVSFEWICESVRFRRIGKQFADGDIEALYQALDNGYQRWDAESGVVRLAYADAESYDADMKEAIAEKYHRYFDGRELTYEGIEDIGYREIPGAGPGRTLSVCLKFCGEEDLEYHILFYRTLNGQYLADDFFGDPYLVYTDGAADPAPQAAQPYRTEDSLFSCLPNGLREYDWYMSRYIMRTAGQRSLQGDTALIEDGQLRLSILSREDLAEGTDSLRTEIERGLAQLAGEGYYLTDLTWIPLEYDRTEHLYRYRLTLELTGKEQPGGVTATLEGYRISQRLVYIPGTWEVCGGGAPSEVSRIIETLCE